MDDTLEALMRLVIGDLELEVLGGHIPAVVRYEGARSRKVSEDTYWAKPDIADRFEKRAAELSVQDGVTRFVLGVPLVIADSEDDLLSRRPIPGPRDFEEEILWLVGVDLSQGVEIGRVNIDRTGGNVSFGPLYTLIGEQRMLDGCPGFTMLQAILEATS